MTAAYSVVIKKSAAKYIKVLEQKLQKAIRDKVDRLKIDPFDPQFSKQLSGVAYRSARVGQFRIIFSVDKVKRRIQIEEIDSRGQVYDRLN